MIDAGTPGVNPFDSFGPSLLTVRPNDTANLVSQSFAGDLLVNGPLLTVPAGKVRLSVRAGFNGNDQQSQSVRSGIASTTDYNRDTENGQASIDVPLTSRHARIVPWLGDFSVNGNVAVQHLTDFGTLTNYGYGARWTPIRRRCAC